MLNIIDLFCGAGGFSEGFRLAGYNILFGLDFNKFAIKTFQYNFPSSIGIQADLTKTSAIEVLNNLNINKKDIHGIIGGPPCQGFSIAGKRLIEDPRNKLFKEFVEFVRYIEPKFFLMENVPGLLSMNDGKVKDEIIETFTSLGYNVKAKVLIATDYNVPQIRKRLFFLGFKEKEPEFPKPITISPLTVWDAIGDLPSLGVGEGSDEFIANTGQIIYNHYSFPMEEINIARLQNIPEGGSHKDLPEHLKRKKQFNCAYRRLDRNKPSHTINTHFRDEYCIHPTQNRIITLREAARIQTFPDNFIFLGPNSRIGKLGQVGNAVPPLLSKALAEHIKLQI